MTLTEIKDLKCLDFETRNSEVWDAIGKLSLSEINELRGHWDSEEIENSIWDIYNEKAEQLFKSQVIDKLTAEQQTALNILCFDKDTMWDYFRRWTSEDV